MNNNRKIQEYLPPYCSYSSWRKLLGKLRDYLPSRIDRSYLAKSGFTESTIFSVRPALHFLDLVNSEGGPTGKLERLVQSGESNFRDVLRQIVEEAYSPLFKQLPVEKATLGQLRDYFNGCGASPHISDKCVTFFIAITSEAGIELSPHMSAKSGVSAVKAKVSRKRSEALKQKASFKKAPSASLSWEELLLKKFPEFDPAWPDDAKSKWFDSFDKLIERKPPGKESR